MDIKIIAVPDGPAPLWVREAWVGVQIRFAQIGSDIEIEDFEGKSMGTVEGYRVWTNLALYSLREKNEEAARWFETNLPFICPMLVFGIDEAELVASN